MKDNNVLLLRRFNTGYEDGNYSMIAWHVDPNETFTDCIMREAKEEAWIKLDINHLKVVHIMHRNSWLDKENERIDAFFVAEKWNWEIVNKESHKCDDLSWFNIDNLPKNTIPYIKFALENIRNGIFYSEFGWD
jgi:8-oxo-dGTP pyrophosphatase MutT (NUDIX family)